MLIASLSWGNVIATFCGVVRRRLPPVARASSRADCRAAARRGQNAPSCSMVAADLRLPCARAGRDHQSGTDG
eukprot:5249634-Prymnesium_polylepis.1